MHQSKKKTNVTSFRKKKLRCYQDVLFLQDSCVCRPWSTSKQVSEKSLKKVKLRKFWPLNLEFSAYLPVFQQMFTIKSTTTKFLWNRLLMESQAFFWRCGIMFVDSRNAFLFFFLTLFDCVHQMFSVRLCLYF